MFSTVGLKNAFNMILLGTHYVLALYHMLETGSMWLEQAAWKGKFQEMHSKQ